MKHRAWHSLALAASLAAGSGLAQAIGVTDVAGDFVPSYTGPQGGDLDVIGAFVTYNAATKMFLFSGTLNADIGTTPAVSYVFGINRGTGTARFAPFPGVLFDAVVRIAADGSGGVNLVGGNGAGTATVLNAGTGLVAGTTFIAQISESLLPSSGFAPSAYTWNLWPRVAAPAGLPGISDFAPDNANLPVTVLGVVPEPGTYALMALGLAGLAALRRRRG